MCVSGFSSDGWVSYFQIMRQGTQIWLQNKYRSTWPLFHGLVLGFPQALEKLENMEKAENLYWKIMDFEKKKKKWYIMEKSWNFILKGFWLQILQKISSLASLTRQFHNLTYLIKWSAVEDYSLCESIFFKFRLSKSIDYPLSVRY